ncbi:MAG: putative F0F1-ATPase subunit Ca2+/Mg2+ transporter [Rickettsiaceae bacterium]|jgi:F0F1-type ATP synthase assembly protein I|nr:putative F0F1-ATPase subunit Ca2+/Mg2+ transporter [Rickettsiaceae bacterium]
MIERNDLDLDLLQQKIDKIREAKSQKKREKFSRGTNILIEMLAAIIIGLLIGWYLDSAFNTRPLGLILCTIFGFLGGIRNLMSK